MTTIAANRDRPRPMSFIAWAVIGAALFFGVLSFMTIGIFVLPIAVLALLALLKWGGSRDSSIGLISGAGLPLLYVGYLNRNGPGRVCTTIARGAKSATCGAPLGPGDVCSNLGSAGQQCVDEWSPWPWLLIGAILVAVGILLFFRLRGATRNPD